MPEIHLQGPEPDWGVERDQEGILWLTCHGSAVLNLDMTLRAAGERYSPERQQLVRRILTWRDNRLRKGLDTRVLDDVLEVLEPRALNDDHLWVGHGGERPPQARPHEHVVDLSDTVAEIHSEGYPLDQPYPPDTRIRRFFRRFGMELP